MKFKMGPNFERNLARQVQPTLDRAEQAHNRIARSHAGRPVDEVERALRTAFRAVPGVTIPDAKIKEFAKRISAT